MDRFFARTKRAFAWMLALVLMVTSIPTMSFADEKEEPIGEEIGYDEGIIDPYRVYIGEGLSDTGEKAGISGFSYIEMSVSGNGELKAEGSAQKVDISGGLQEVMIAPNNIIKLFDLEYDDQSPYGAVSVVDKVVFLCSDEELETVSIDITANESGEFISPQINTTCGIDLGAYAKKLSVENVKIKENQEHLDKAEPFTIDESCLTQIGDETYVNRGNLYFRLNPVNGRRISKAKYRIGDEIFNTEASYDSEKEEYYISQGEVIKGILNGGITLEAEFEPLPPVIVVFNEATGKNRENENEKTLTKTNILVGYDSVSDNEYTLSGGSIAFTCNYEEGLTDYEVELGMPTATIGNDDKAVAIDVSYNEAGGVYFLNEEDVAAAAAAGKKIYINANAKAIPLSEVTIDVDNYYLTGIRFSEYKTVDGKDICVRKHVEYINKNEGWEVGSGRSIKTFLFQTGNTISYDDYMFFDGSMDRCVLIGIEDGGDYVFRPIRYTYKGSNPVFASVPQEVKDKKIYHKIDTVVIETDDENVITGKTVKLPEESDISPNELRLSVSCYRTTPVYGKNTMEIDDNGNVTFVLRINDDRFSETIFGYTFSGDIQVAYSKSVVPINQSNVTLEYGNTEAWVTLPASEVTAYLLTDPDHHFTFIAGVEKGGYRNKSIEIHQEYASANTRIKSGGKSLYYDYMGTLYYDWGNDSNYQPSVKYGKDAEITVKPLAGYELETTYLISTKSYKRIQEEIKNQYPLGLSESRTRLRLDDYSLVIQWIKNTEDKSGYDIKEYKPDENGIISFKIDKVETSYCILNETKPQIFAEVNIDGKITPVEDSGVFDILYNAPTSVKIYNGRRGVDIGDENGWTIKVYKENAKTKTFGEIDKNLVGSIQCDYGNEEYFAFDASLYPGSRFILTIESTETIGGEGEDKNEPKYSFEFTFNVSKKITSKEVSFSAEDGFLELPLGTTRTYELSYKNSFYNTEGPEQLGVYLKNNSGPISEDIIKPWVFVDRDEETIAVTLESFIKSRNVAALEELINAEDIVAVLYDKNDSYKTEIDSVEVYFTDSYVKEADLEYVSVTSGPDTLMFDFTTLNLDDELLYADGLYYVIDVSANTRSDEFTEGIDGILVPATAEKFSVVLANHYDAYEAEQMEYTVKVGLVQVTDMYSHTSMYTDDSYGVFDSTWSVCSSKKDERTISTIPNGVFPTKVTLKKEKAAGKIYSTMDRIKVAKVVYDNNKGGVNLVKRLKRVDLQDKNGNVIYNSYADPEVIEVIDNEIYINPKEGNLAKGKYTIVAYPVQPMGKDLPGKLTIDILQGIEDISVAYTPVVYLKSKGNTTIKPRVSYNVDSNTKPRDKKLTWSFVDRCEEEYGILVPGEEIDYGSDITINKSGVITIKKGYKLPDEGLTLYVYTQAADHKGNSAADITTVRIQNTPQTIDYVYVYCEETDASAKIEEGGNYYSAQLYGVLECCDETYTDVDATYSVTGIKGKKNAKGFTEVHADGFTNRASITATTTDGSKGKKKVNFKVISDKDLTFSLTDANAREIKLEETASGYSYENNRASGNSFFVNICGANRSLIDHKISVTGAEKKVVSQGTGSEYDRECYGTTYKITPNAAETVIKLTDTVAKKDTVIKFTNTLIGAKASTSVKASNKYVASVDLKKGKITEKDLKGSIFAKLYFHGEEYEEAGSINKVTYTVKVGNKPAAGEYVVVDAGDSEILGDLFSRILENDKPLESVSEPVRGRYYREKRFVVPLDKDGTFTIDYSDYRYYPKYSLGGSLKESGILFDIPEGTYSFTVTPIDDMGKAIAKPATVKFKATSAPKASVSIKANITDFESNGTINITGFSNIVFGKDYIPARFEFDNLRGDNKKGTISKFATVFDVYNVGVVASDKTIAYTLYCKKNPENYDLLYTKDHKNGLTGYATYTYRNLDGSKGTGQIKIKVTPKKNGEIKEAIGN